MHVARRDLLVGGVLWTIGIAGCLDDTDEDDGADEDDGGAQTTDGQPNDSDAGDSTASDETDLDLREANVTAVAVEQNDDGYRFDVTLYHDDDGEDGYANWWQVETLEGDRLGRRDLAHAHGTQEFTRSATVSVPSDATCVVVRGHDQTHAYGGQAMLVTLETGATRAVRQGSENQSFETAECP
ncbi:hypothetical protein ACFOZ7_04965 [Natribaculum luteum]|uniref:Lipoprotein n=1 Tax=Natribaculum luteum TaxID=1586232 RepID=A0ABD5NW86_9EURY|nr:hypothetical protein [Natribaculum luteum]